MALPQETEDVLTNYVIALEMAMLVSFSAALLWYYQAKEVPWLIGGTVFVSWLLGFMGTLLLPADIVLTLLNGEHSGWVTNVWYTVYWTTFFLAWVAIPMLASSWQAGDLTWPERLRSALLLNIRLYLLMALGLVVFVIYLVISGQTSMSRVSGFMMALANTYGLLFIILLLGHGLAKVPQQLWQTSFSNRELQRLYFIATQVDSDMHDAMYELEEVERDLDCLERAIETKKPWTVRDRQHLLQLLAAARETAEVFHGEIDDGSFRTARFTGKHGSQRWDDGRTPAEALKDLGVASLSAKDAARLHSNLRATQMKVVAARLRWESLLRETDTLLCLVNDNIPWGPGVCNETPGATAWERVVELGNRLRRRLGWIWRVYLRSLCCKAMAVLCAGLSVVILWSEVVMESGWNLSPFGVLLRAMYRKESGVAHALSMQAAVLVPFLYMSLCCYRSLFTLKILGAYTLQGNHHSLPEPLLFNAQYLIRLQFPLGYNFMRILRYYGTNSTEVPGLQIPAFQKLMNDMNTVPVLGTSFNVYAPMVLVVLCLFTFCKGYARAQRLVGLEHEDLVSIEDPDGKARLDEGRGLIERGKRHAQVIKLRQKERASGSPASSTVSLAGGRKGASNVAPSLAYSQIEDETTAEEAIF